MEITYALSETTEVAAHLLTTVTSRTLLFYGKMGVGKTTLIKELVAQLGGGDLSASPSFSIVNEYETDAGLVYHFDFYRIENLEEAYDLGFEDYLHSGAYIFIEWPEKIEPLLPPDSSRVYINRNEDGRRTLKIQTGN